ncbi:ParB/RepB/Spo0J family partition protein [Hydrogenimonas sp.]
MGKKGKSKSLGRGLGAILGEVAEAYENEFKADSREIKEHVAEIPLDEIVPNPYQPRTHFDENAIAELAESIKRHGLLQPVVVIEQGDGTFMLIAGERRVRASRMAGMETIRAIVADIDESKFRELALIENIQREELNPVELARSYRELIEEYGITQEELAKIIHKSRSQIANTMRLLQLSDYALEKVATGQVSQGHAKMLVGLDEKEQRILCDTIVGQKLSVRETEELVGGMKGKKEGAKKGRSSKPAGIDLNAYREVIEQNVPFRISVKRSKVEITFADEEELKDFLKIFAKKV